MAGESDTIAAKDVWKSYGHVHALRGASISIRRGEVVALVGDNGAGKSTLMKVMCGALRPDSGSIAVLGDEREFLTVREAQDLGVQVVYQDLAGVSPLSDW